MSKKTIEHVEVSGRHVLARVDFNVPLDNGGQITADRRIRLALPTIRSVIDRGGRLVLMSHLGRPKGNGPEPGLSLAPVARRLRELLGQTEVRFIGDDCASEASAVAVDALADGEILVLENLRFNAGEKSGDKAFAGTVSDLGDVYCHEAFGTAHRGDASVVAVPCAMVGRPRVAGLLLERELRFLSDTLARGGDGLVAILGGAKVSDKLGAIRNLTGRVGTILIGGAMAYTFLKCQGHAVGASLVEDDRLDEARAALAAADTGSTTLLLPTDHIVGQALEAQTPVETVLGAIPDGWMGLDIGPETVSQYTAVIREARTVIWNGPMGAFEIPPFDTGTRQLAEVIADATAGGLVSVIGGGDSAAAMEAFGLAERFSHVSTGGGASLQMLEGRRFESVELLDEA